MPAGRAFGNLMRSQALRRAGAAIGPRAARQVHTQLIPSFDRARASKLVVSKFAFGQRRGFCLPAHDKMAMPALSPTMTQGNIATWVAKEGDTISAGDVLCEIETDKATLAFEAQDEGVLAKILVPEGENDVPVGKILCIMVQDKADAAAFATYTDDSPAAAAAPVAPSAPAAPATPAPTTPPVAPAAAVSAPPPPSAGRVFASPLARRLATEKGVDLQQIAGSGPNARIVASDVREFDGAAVAAVQPVAAAPRTATPVSAAPAAPAAAAAAGEFMDMPLSNVRKVIADRLLESKQTIPHYYLTMDCRVDEILALRKKLNERKGADYKLSVNDFVIKAAACALKQVPEVNSSWQGTSIRTYNYVDISVAVSTDGGLITPIVKDADAKGFASISADVQGLAERARAGKLTPDEYVGGTFTISNLGMYGVSSFSAIINPPQAAILAVGGSKPVVASRTTEDGKEYFETQVMSVTLSCDHRVVDGAVGAQWLQKFKGFIEDPLTMLL